MLACEAGAVKRSAPCPRVFRWPIDNGLRPRTCWRQKPQVKFDSEAEWQRISRLSACSAIRPRNTAPAKSIAPSAKVSTIYGSAPTVCTIVQTAAKRATSRLPITDNRVQPAPPALPPVGSRRKARSRCRRCGPLYGGCSGIGQRDDPAIPGFRHRCLQALFPLPYFRSAVRNYTSPFAGSTGGGSLPKRNRAPSRPKAFLGGNR